MEKPKGKVSGNQAHKLLRKAISSLDDIYSSVRQFKSTYEHIMEQIQERITPIIERLPAYQKGYFAGYHEALRTQLWNKLIWMLFCDGKLLTSKEVDRLTKEEQDAGLDKMANYRSPWSRIDGDKSRHVWPDADGHPLRDKPFDRKFLTS